MFKRLLSLFFCLVILITIPACKKEEVLPQERSVATLDNENIEESYFKFYFTTIKKSMQKTYGEIDWQNATYNNKPILEYVRELALQSVIEDKIIISKAKELGIKLTDDDKSKLSDLKKSWISLYGDEKKFVDGIKNEYGLSVEQFDSMLEADYYANHLIKKYVADTEILDYYNQNIIKVKHILIPTVILGTTIPLTADELKDAEKKVKLVLNKIDKGDDFDSLVTEYTEDNDTFYYVGKGYALNVDGTKGMGMMEEFETACFTLNVGEVSGVVESPYGYHIIKRYENDEAMYNIAKDTMASVLFTDVMENWKSQKKLVINYDIYNSYK